MKKIDFIMALNLLTVVLIFILPYYIFEGKLYVGGDDTRLFYTYPLEFVKTVNLFSWSNQATIGINSSSQSILLFLVSWSFLDFLIPSKTILTYLAFSLPLTLAFIFFQKAVKEIFSLGNENGIELYLGAIFYVFSPILIHNQYFIFLTSIWMLGYIPMIIFLFIRFLRTDNFKYALFAALVSMIFTGIMYSIPWLSGFMLPLFLGIIIGSFLFKLNEKIYFVKKFIIFFGFVFLTQAYWLSNFILSYLIKDSSSFVQKYVSKDFLDTFIPTIAATGTGNIFYPFFNLFHRQITIDFHWALRDVFLSFYDITFIVGLIFIITFSIGLLDFKRVLGKLDQRIFIIFLIGLVFSVYFLTVNIGPLKEVFVQLRFIPGFVMFRNFYDKFAPGFVIIYAILITISLVIVKIKVKHYKIVFLLFFLAVFINALPIKQTINSPLWTTKNIYKTIRVPQEYTDFMAEVRKRVPPTNMILNLPFGSSIYSIIKDENSNNAYVGASPVKVFSGVGDIAGHYSFNFTEEANYIDKLLVTKNFNKLNDVLYKFNINYIMLTKNVPDEVKKSYVFSTDILEVQDEDFLNAITSGKIVTSSSGNYELHKSKKKNSLIDSENISFKKVSQVKYRLYFTGIKNSQELDFRDSFHGGWKLYLVKNPQKNWCGKTTYNDLTKTYECQWTEDFFKSEDLGYMFKRNLFAESHNIRNGFSNYWEINPSYIKSNFPPEYYRVNKDGSMDMEMVLYFVPQNYFYLGIIISIVVFLSGGIYLYKNRIHGKNK